MGRVRPSFYPELGLFFQKLREDRQLGQRQVAEIARRRGLKALSRQVLLRLENGQTKNPDPKVLRAIATLYEMRYEDLVARVVAHHYGINLKNAVQPIDRLSHDLVEQSEASTGGADVTSSAHVLAERDRLRHVLAEIKAVAFRVIDIIVASEGSRQKNGTTPATPPKRRKRDRRTG